MVQIGNFFVGEGEPLALIAGPCVIESETLVLETAARLKEICETIGMPLIFKSSYDKANRTSVSSFRGPGLREGLDILQKVKEMGVLVTTDVHSPEEARIAGEVVDVIQIPALLSRQTDLLVAAGETGRVVSVKKGQFTAPWDMRPAVEKIKSTGNNQIILMDRGTCFGYNNLVSDMRAIPIMKELGVPVCFDATHSVQRPASLGATTGGERQFIPTLAKAAVAAGADLIFMETHPSPEMAKCDAASQLPLDQLPELLSLLKQLHGLTCSANLS